MNNSIRLTANLSKMIKFKFNSLNLIRINSFTTNLSRFDKLKPLPILSNSTSFNLTCTEFDSIGNVKTVAGEFSKVELCDKHGLQYRDLRKLDGSFINQLPSILVRDSALLVNLLQLRAIIKSDTVILFEESITKINSKLQSKFIYDLQERLRPNSQLAQALPFEFSLSEEVVTTSVQVENLLDRLESDINREQLKLLLHQSISLSNLDKTISMVRNAIFEVLEQDEDLDLMYLTRRKLTKKTITSSHTEIELLLETYLKQVDELSNQIGNLISRLKSTEAIVNIILDWQRNALLRIELKVTIITLGLTTVAMGTSIFGMNLVNYLEADNVAFFAVVGTCGLLATLVSRRFLRNMKDILSKTK